MNLTRRQTEILNLIAEGQSDKEIARALGMSRKTVSAHLQRVYDKFDVRTRAGAVAQWIVGDPLGSVGADEATHQQHGHP